MKARRAVEKVSSNYCVEQLSIKYAVQDLWFHVQAAPSDGRSPNNALPTVYLQRAKITPALN